MNPLTKIETRNELAGIAYLEYYLTEGNKIVSELTTGKNLIEEYMNNEKNLSDEEKKVLNQKLAVLTNKINDLYSTMQSLGSVVEEAKKTLDYSGLYEYFKEHADDILPEDMNDFLE